MSRKRLLILTLFFLYALFMLWLLFGQRLFHMLNSPPSDTPYLETLAESLNLIPFRTVIAYLTDLTAHTATARHAFINLGGNLLLFIPLGIFLPLLSEKLRRLPQCMHTAALLLLAVELIQLLTTLGSFDVDDLILNLAGTLIGALIIKCLPHKS